MATATKHVETVETVTGVTLELSHEEARTLAVVLSFVGGPLNGPRHDAHCVLEALGNAGIPRLDHEIRDCLASDSSSVRFNAYPEEV